MSELRAPDVTLDNCIYDVGLDFRESIITAHLLDHRGCGAEVDHPLPGPVYAYTAVACRDCFPDAPQRGVDHLDRPMAGRYLAWQVNP